MNSWLQTKNELPLIGEFAIFYNVIIDEVLFGLWTGEEWRTPILMKDLGIAPAAVTHWMPLPDRPVDREEVEVVTSLSDGRVVIPGDTIIRERNRVLDVSELKTLGELWNTPEEDEAWEEKDL